MEKTVLVTGGPGFIGRRVVERFLDHGWGVTSFSLPGETEPPGWRGRVSLRFGDIADKSSIHAAMSTADLVIHLAAVVGLAGEYERQWSIIAAGTRNVMAAAAERRARVVVASSIAVYGDKIRSRVCSEDVGHGAWQGAYGRAKQGQEQIALEFAKRHGLPMTIIRPANVYGLGGASAWGDRMIDLLRATGGGVIGDGENNVAGLVYVENLADAIFLAATRPEAIGKTYNVCDENGVSWSRFNDDMASLAGVPSPPQYPLADILSAVEANENPASLKGPADPSLPSLEAINLVGFDNRFPSALISRDLGWSPRYSYDDACREMALQLASEQSGRAHA